MEISFQHNTQPGYRELLCPVRRMQVTAESVVPDTDEDVGKIASVQPMLLLKSKDVTAHGVSVSGELNVALLCITEGENRFSSVHIKRDFQMDFDMEGLQGDALAQISLSVGSTEARVLNPRKLSVTAELVGELCCYRQEELPVETKAPDTAAGMLHCREESAVSSLIEAVREKTFALSEQFRFPEGKGEPAALLSQSVCFETEDVQQVGSRAVVKGTVHIGLCYAVKGENYPAAAAFSAPFSQLVDTGTASCDSAAVRIELTGVYFDLVDTISGEKALDAELHAVLQLVSRTDRELWLLTDAYSNRFPTSCSFQQLSVSRVSPVQRLRLSAEDALDIAEDCEDVLCVLPNLPPLIQSSVGLGGTVYLDVIYRSKGGTLSAVRRMLALEEESCPVTARLCAARLTQQDFRLEGKTLRCRVSVEAQLMQLESQELCELAAVTAEEDAPWDSQSFPSVTLVRASTESLWSLAKRYHSSVSAIEAFNREQSGVLLIPRE